jgi:hypothetical protein
VLKLQFDRAGVAVEVRGKLSWSYLLAFFNALVATLLSLTLLERAPDATPLLEAVRQLLEYTVR